MEGEKGEEHLKKMMNSVYGEREREKKERKEGFHGFCVLAELGSVFEQNKGSPDLTTCQRSRTKNFKTARAELRIRSSGLNQQAQSFFVQLQNALYSPSGLQIRSNLCSN